MSAIDFLCMPREKGILAFIANLLLEFKPLHGGRVPNEAIVRCAEELYDLKDEAGKKLRWREVGEIIDAAFADRLKNIKHAEPNWIKQYVKIFRTEMAKRVGQGKRARVPHPHAPPILGGEKILFSYSPAAYAQCSCFLLSAMTKESPCLKARQIDKSKARVKIF